jgi:hypothetical protein
MQLTKLLNIQHHIWKNIAVKPKVVYWIQPAVVRPTVTYAISVVAQS